MRLWGKVSLILGPLILVTALDVLSFVRPFRSHPKSAPSWGIKSVQGELAFFRVGSPQEPGAFINSRSYQELDELSQASIKHGWYLHYRDPNDPAPKLHADGFYSLPNGVGPCSETAIPYWSLLLLGCVPPIVLMGCLIAHADQYRRPKGLCGQCSYDLRGNTSGIWPECGTKWDE